MLVWVFNASFKEPENMIKNLYFRLVSHCFSVCSYVELLCTSSSVFSVSRIHTFINVCLYTYILPRWLLFLSYIYSLLKNFLQTPEASVFCKYPIQILVILIKALLSPNQYCLFYFSMFFISI